MSRPILLLFLVTLLIAVVVVLLTLPKAASRPLVGMVSVPDTTVALTTLLYSGDEEAPLTEQDEWDAAWGGCSLLCAFGWRTEASSALAPQGANRYEVDQAEDGDPNTAWVEGVDGPGIGEELTFLLGAGEELPDGMVTSLWGLRVFNGYGKSERAWEANGRVRYLDVLLNDEPVVVVELHDLMMVQEATWDGVDVRPGDRVTLRIADVYPGARYEDTAITEVLLMGAH